ncbi:MAG: aromatic amino acid transport family protein [Gammaproteobacteria bacterium]|jgi:aromatic amino acid transport protein
MNKFLGSTLIVTGTAFGAGMLALPMISAAAGLFPALILLIVIWAVMLFTGLLTLEVNLAFPVYRNNFSTMSRTTLGIVGQVTAWIACLALLYSLTAAYVAGDASLLSVGVNSALNIKLPEWIYAVLFVLILGGAVFWSARAVDILNRAFISIKGFLFIIALVLLIPHISWHTFARSSGSAKYVWSCAPIFLCAFGFHHIVPSLANYIGPRPKTLKWVIIIGAFIPLMIYVIWLIVVLGIIPLSGNHSFMMLVKKNGSVGEFMRFLIVIANNRWLTASVDGFSNVAMTTSFLGVTLGLFDFLADAFRRVNTRVGRAQTALLTFIPPLIFAIFYPKGFVVALGYAAIFAAILTVILPALMVYKLRKHSKLSSPYRVFGGTPLLVIAMIAGVLVIGLQIANGLHLLPKLL